MSSITNDMIREQPPPVRVLIADDHRMIRAGIRAMLSLTTTQVRCELDEAETTEQAMDKADRLPFDVILMDVHLPGRGGVKATELILRRHPAVRILGLSSYDELTYVEKMLNAGARGYLLKNVEPDTLVSAIRSVMEGKRFFSNEIGLKLMDPRLNPSSPSPLERLTAREKEILGQILAGFTDREIGARLSVSKRTVDKHRQHIMRKLAVRNAVELAEAGLRLRLVK